jgi:hypothetical protein
LRFELLPLIEAARTLAPRPLIVASVRDVMRRSVSAERVAETVETFRIFDAMLIHGDPALVSFDRSFAGWEQVKARAVYTGYVAEADVAGMTGDAGTGEVIVSVGGGAVGAPLLKAAVAARPRTRLADRTWRLLVGASLPAGERTALAAAQGVLVEPARRDSHPAARAALSISRAVPHRGRSAVPRDARLGRSRSAKPSRPIRAQLLADRGRWQSCRRRVSQGHSARGECAPARPLDPAASARNAGGAAATVDWLHRRLA